MGFLDKGAIKSDADWIMSAVLPSGGIAWFSDQSRIAPYMAHYAAIGLIKAFKVLGDQTYMDAVWGWFDWYRDHMDGDGYVTDYTVSGGVETSTGDMDSTDAYAGMFLVALYEAMKVNRDLVQLATYADAIALALNAIQSTQEPDGLTWTKPAFHSKAFMDQTEAYAGLLAAVELAALLDDSALGATAQAAADAMAEGIATMWDSDRMTFDVQKSDVGVLVNANLSTLNPDALAQAWAVGWLVTNGSLLQTEYLLRLFEQAQPNWDQPAAIGNNYYPFAAQAYVAMGHYERAFRAWQSIRRDAIAASRGWPFTTMNAGQLIALAVDSQPHLGGPVYDSVTLAPSGSTGNLNPGDSAVVGTHYRQLALQFVVEVAGATPTVTFKFQGSVDGENWVDVAYVPSDSDTVDTTALTVTAEGATVVFLANPAARTYAYIRPVVTANTNVTFRAEAYPVA